MQHLEISRAWGGPHPTLLVTDFQWLGTADVVVGTPGEEQTSHWAILSVWGVLSCNSPPYCLCRCIYCFTCIFCSTWSGFPSLAFVPSHVANCLVRSPLHPSLQGCVLQPHARGSVALCFCKILRKFVVCDFQHIVLPLMFYWFL